MRCQRSAAGLTRTRWTRLPDSRATEMLVRSFYWMDARILTGPVSPRIEIRKLLAPSHPRHVTASMLILGPCRSFAHQPQWAVRMLSPILPHVEQREGPGHAAPAARGGSDSDASSTAFCPHRMKGTGTGPALESRPTRTKGTRKPLSCPTTRQ
jgi:hypothetical protein